MTPMEWNRETYDKIINQIKNNIIKDLVNFVYAKMYTMINETVYDVFTPKQYERRKDFGGLSDITNFSYDLKFTEDGFTVKIYDDALAVGGAEGESLDKYIVEGIYDYPNTPDKRDFYGATMEYMIKSGELEEFVKLKLKDSGFSFRN